MFGLSQRTLDDIHQVLQHYPQIHWVKIYGSRALETYHSGSDIDLAFSADEDLSIELLAELDALPTPYFFDVTYYDTLQNQSLKSHIDRVGKPILANR